MNPTMAELALGMCKLCNGTGPALLEAKRKTLERNL